MLLEADLPEDIEALRSLALEQSRQLDTLIAEQATAGAEVERLRAIIEALQRHQFGRRSEQLDYDQLQLGLEDVEAALALAEAADAVNASPAQGARSRKTNRGSLPTHLERAEQLVDVEARHAPAAAKRFIRSARTYPSGLMSCRRRFACWSPAGRATVAAHARAQWSRPRRRRGSSKAVSQPKR